MTLREDVEAAAFWEGWVCLACDHTSTEEEDHDEGDECPECGTKGLVSAKRLERFLERVYEDDPPTEGSHEWLP